MIYLAWMSPYSISAACSIRSLWLGLSSRSSSKNRYKNFESNEIVNDTSVCDHYNNDEFQALSSKIYFVWLRGIIFTHLALSPKSYLTPADNVELVHWDLWGWICPVCNLHPLRSRIRCLSNHRTMISRRLLQNCSWLLLWFWIKED